MDYKYIPVRLIPHPSAVGGVLDKKNQQIAVFRENGTLEKLLDVIKLMNEGYAVLFYWEPATEYTFEEYE